MRFRADVSVADTEYGQVLLDERTGRYWQLNPTGALVVKHLLDGGNTEQVVATLTTEFLVPEDRARQDVVALVDSLRSAGLVTT